jgi:nucleoid-associated protein YgaU
MKNIGLLFGAGILLFIIYSCGPAVPTKEIEDAKTAIERAKTVDAPVYAAQDFMEAQDDLNQATNLVEAKNNQEAHDKAVMSKTAADKSYESARMARAEDIYQKCGDELTSAGQNFADKLVPDKYSSLSGEFTNLTVIYNTHDYDSIYSNGVSLYPKLKELADYSSGMVSNARDAIGEAQNSYDEASEKEIVRQYALEDLKKAAPLIDEARTSLSVGELDNTIEKSKEALSIIDAAEKKAETAYQNSMKGITNSTETIDIGKQQEMEKEKKQASDAINEARKKYEQVTNRLKGSFLGSSLIKFADIEMPFIFFKDDMADMTATNTLTNGMDTNNQVVIPPQNDTNGTDTNNQAVIPPQNDTNTISPVKDEDITPAIIEKYIKMAQDSFNKAEYLDATDYAKEASRMSDILLSKEQFRIYTVKLRPGNRDCLWKISGFMYDDQYSLWPIIWSANKYQIQDPDLIYPGQELKIPPIPEK